MTDTLSPLPPIPTGQDTASLLAGNEIALMEVLFYLLDKGVVDKIELAERLELGAKNIERMLNEEGKNGAAMAFTTRRIAYALRSAVLVDDEGNPV